MQVEARTLWLITAILSACSGILAMAMRRHHADHTGKALSLWGWACLCSGVALAMSAADERVASSAGPLLGSVGIALRYLAVARFRQQTRQAVWTAMPIVSACAVYLWFGLLRPDIDSRMAAFNAIRVVMLLRTAYIFTKREKDRLHFIDRLSAGTYVALGIWTTGVIIDFFLHGHSASGYNFDSARTVYNGGAMAVAHTVLTTLFLLAITESQNARVKEQAMHDPLTGLLNRGAIEEIGMHQNSLSRRAGQALSALMIDVDHFKLVNDTYGHATGDLVLKSVARVLLRGLRDGDYVGRWGGDEFCVLLPGALSGDAERVAKRILNICANSTHSAGEKGEKPTPLSLSIGVATIEGHAGGFERLMANADAALYQAKKAGKGRHAVAESALSASR